MTQCTRGPIIILNTFFRRICPKRSARPVETAFPGQPKINIQVPCAKEPSEPTLETLAPARELWYSSMPVARPNATNQSSIPYP